ncbi:MAG: AAA family ATPase [Deltaproteobacteria bacterium]|nr:AAA family ATPase [Deltaproteobacteria bacterium]
MRNYLSSNFAALFFDELHKYSNWRNYLKGLYDKEKTRFQILVTGSALFDVYRKKRDSLFGRYELLRLHPFSVDELVGSPCLKPSRDIKQLDLDSELVWSIWRKLETFGGFPEPYFKEDLNFYRRWQRRRRELIIYQDLNELTNLKMNDLVEHLWLLLVDRASQRLSINKLSKILEVAYNTVSNWILAVEKVWMCYTLKPYFLRLSRSLQKDRKLYLYDWALITDPSAKLENKVATHLLKLTQVWTDLGYGEFGLFYWQNKD